jgi:micrococcal nuclease
MYIYNAKVVRIVDGDTIILDIDLGFNTWINNHWIRLEGIDTPEIRTKNPLEKEAGFLAKDFVEKHIEVGDIITVKTIIDKKEKFGRTLGTIFSKEGVNINEELLKNNLAIKYVGQTKAQIKIEHNENLKLLLEKNLIDQSGNT